MNYLSPKVWDNPEIESIRGKILAEAFEKPYIDNDTWLYEENHKEMGSVRFSLDIKIYPTYNDIMLSIAPEAHSNLKGMVLHSLHVPVMMELISKSIYIMDSTYLDTILRGLFWINYDRKFLIKHGMTAHQEIEWGLDRRESWKKAWDYRPDGVE